MSEILGISMFAGSVVTFITRKYFSTLREEKYIQTLKKLFVPLANMKYNPNVSQDAILQQRKAYFQSIMSESMRKHTQFIHIAGSKGKGSTTEYMAAGLRQQGYQVGVFTSPHLHTARERIKINKALINQDDITRLGTIVIDEMSKFEWTVFFDLFLAIAIKYFGEHRLDYILLETGIGGRYDSTNFVDAPVACVITSISLDHQALLGNTTAEIAWQKAGIIKPNSPVFTPASQEQDVLAVFEKECLKTASKLTVVPSSRYITLRNISLVNHHCTTLPVETLLPRYRWSYLTISK